MIDAQTTTEEDGIKIYIGTINNSQQDYSITIIENGKQKLVYLMRIIT